MLRTAAIVVGVVVALSSVSFANPDTQTINMGGSRQVTFQVRADHDRAPYALTGESRTGPKFEVVRLTTQSVTIRPIHHHAN